MNLYFEPVAKPMTYDRENDFKVKFAVNDKEDGCMLHVQFTGITGQILKDYPEVKEIREHSYKHFSLAYRPFASSSIEKFIGILMKIKISKKGRSGI